jgi:hypothetical protein
VQLEHWLPSAFRCALKPLLSDHQVHTSWAYFVVRHNNTRRLLTGTMAKNKPNLFNLELIRQKKLLIKQTTIIATFSHGMRPATPEAVTEVASQLDNFCPPLEQEKEAKKYLWMSWDIMVNIAMSPDVTSELQNDLVEILQSLRQIAKGELGPVRMAYRFWYLL